MQFKPETRTIMTTRLENIGDDELIRAFQRGSRPTIDEVVKTGRFDVTPLETGRYYFVHSGMDPVIKLKNRDNADEVYLFTIGKHISCEDAERLKRHHLAAHPEARERPARRATRRKARIDGGRWWQVKREEIEPQALQTAKNRNRRTKQQFRNPTTANDQGERPQQTSPKIPMPLETLVASVIPYLEYQYDQPTGGNPGFEQIFQGSAICIQAANQLWDALIGAGVIPFAAKIIIEEILKYQKERASDQTESSYSAMVRKHLESRMAAETIREIDEIFGWGDEDKVGTCTGCKCSATNSQSVQPAKRQYSFLDDMTPQEIEDLKQKIISSVYESVKEELKKNDVDSRPVRTGGERIGTLDPASLGEILLKELRNAIDLINLIRMILGKGPIEDALVKYDHDMRLETAKLELEKKGYQVKPPLSHQDLENFKTEMEKGWEETRKQILEGVRKTVRDESRQNLVVNMLSTFSSKVSSVLTGENENAQSQSNQTSNAIKTVAGDAQPQGDQVKFSGQSRSPFDETDRIQSEPSSDQIRPGPPNSANTNSQQ